MAQIIVCCAQKGGCAKTVTVHNLASALSQMGRKVLTVDFDSQASLTVCFGIAPQSVPVGIAQLMDLQAQDMNMPAKAEYIQHCGGIDLIPSSSSLSAVSESMHHEIGCEQFLSNILSALRDDYDYIIVDTGPKLDNLNINAMIAADQLLIPVNPQYLSTAGLQTLLKMYNKVKRRFNPGIEIAGVLLTMCEQRTNLCKIITQQIRDEYHSALPIFEHSIPMTVKVGESVYYSKSVLEYAPHCTAAVAYQQFAQELDRKLNPARQPQQPAINASNTRIMKFRSKEVI